MLKLLQYMIHRDLKIYVIGLVLNVLLALAVKMNFLKIVGPFTPEMVLGLYTVFLLIMLCDRLTWYIEQGMIFDNREYFLSIPVSVPKILNAIALVACVEFILWYGVMGVLNGFSTIFYDFALIIPMILALILFGSFLLAIIGNVTRNRLNGAFVLGIVFSIGFVVNIVLYSVLNFRIPFLYNGRIGLISLCLLLIGVSYYGLWRKYGISENKTFVHVFVGILLLVAVLTYGLGQSSVYTFRRTDSVPKEFISDPSIIGQWHLAGIDYESTSLTDVDAKQYTPDMSLSMNHYYKLEIDENGRTNYEFQWTKGTLYNNELQYTQQYFLNSLEGPDFLIVEWKTYDYIFNKGNVIYYVYARVM